MSSPFPLYVFLFLFLLLLPSSLSMSLSLDTDTAIDLGIDIPLPNEQHYETVLRKVNGFQSEVDPSNTIFNNASYTPSATPLIVNSPEMSVWSMSDNLYDDTTKHWEGIEMSLNGAIKVDGITYGFLGPSPAFPSRMQQVSKMVLPCTTIYNFAIEEVTLQILFTSVCDQVENVKELSKPYSYVTFSVNNTDPSSIHHVKVYFDLQSDWVLDQKRFPQQNIQFGVLNTNNTFPAHVLRNYDGLPFSLRGDDVKMNWGGVLLAAPTDNRLTNTINNPTVSQAAFASNQPLPSIQERNTVQWNLEAISSSWVWDFGSLSFNQTTGSFITVAYDDYFSMDYFNEWMKPYWRYTYNDNVVNMLLDSLVLYTSSMQRIIDHDVSLYRSLLATAGPPYAIISSLAYRHATGGIKIVWSTVLQDYRVFMKEISSDGDVSTVDVIYPASPFFIAFAPEMLKRMLLPVLQYGNNETNIPYWLPWAPHHLGIWPVCDLTADQQEQMPMEESGNFLMMLTAIVMRQQGEVDWLQPYWALLDSWAQYLISSLPDPGDQLCTDDFEGPSPHNVNLALKGIVALGSYSMLLNYSGQTNASLEILGEALGFASQWMKLANDAGHTRLQYDLPGTWSMKYNMLFHEVLNLALFPPTVMQEEVQFYSTQLQSWGLPLDSRSTLTKTDWGSWIAALSRNQTFSNQIYNYLTKYDVSNGNVLGFRARPVQGGIYAKYLLTMLEEERESQKVEEQ